MKLFGGNQWQKREYQENEKNQRQKVESRLTSAFMCAR